MCLQSQPLGGREAGELLQIRGQPGLHSKAASQVRWEGEQNYGFFFGGGFRDRVATLVGGQNAQLPALMVPGGGQVPFCAPVSWVQRLAPPV